jgi:hypothetical protein
MIAEFAPDDTLSSFDIVSMQTLQQMIQGGAALPLLLVRGLVWQNLVPD